MPLSKEEIRTLIHLDKEIIPNNKERFRKELFQLFHTAILIHECSHQLNFIDLNKNVSGLIQVKLDKLVDVHLHQAFERYLDLLKEMEKTSG